MPNVMQMMSDEQSAQMLEILGLPGDTSDPNLVLQATQDMAAQAGEMRPEQPSSVAAAARQIGCEVIDAATLAALRHDAAHGRQLAAEARAQEIRNAVDKAIERGAITPARREHWCKLIEADPEAANTLASFPDELGWPKSELGHSRDPIGQPGADNDAWVL